MESILGASGEISQDYLKFKTPPVSISVLSRQSTRWYPSGNQFGPNGVRNLKVVLSDAAGGGWLLPWTLSLRMLVSNKSGTGNDQTMRLPIHGIFRTLVVNCGGVQAERLDDYAKLYSMIREVLAPSYTQDELHIGSG